MGDRLVLVVDGAHERGRRGQDLVDKDEDGLFRRELDPLSDDVDELCPSKQVRAGVIGERSVAAHLTDCQVLRDEVLLLVDGRDVTLLQLLANDLLVSVSTVAGKGPRGARRTGIRSWYLDRIRCASACRFSVTRARSSQQEPHVSPIEAPRP